MARLGALADQSTPVLTDLGAVAPDINRMLEQLGPFSHARASRRSSPSARRPTAARRP